MLLRYSFVDSTLSLQPRRNSQIAVELMRCLGNP